MKLKIVTGLLLGWFSVSVLAVDFNTLPPDIRTTIHAETDAAFYKQCPEKDGQALDPTSSEDAPYRKKWMAIRNQIVAREYPDPADNYANSTQTAENSLAPNGSANKSTREPYVVEIKMRKKPQATFQQQTIQFEGDLVIMNGVLNSGDRATRSFVFSWDANEVKNMDASASFIGDSNMRLLVTDSMGVTNFYLLGDLGEKKQNSLWVNPGRFNIEVYNNETIQARPTDNNKFLVTIQFYAHQQSHAPVVRNANPSTANDVSVLSSILNAASTSQPIRRAVPPPPSSSSGTHTSVTVPVSIRDANGNLHTTPSGTVTLPTSP